MTNRKIELETTITTNLPEYENKIIETKDYKDAQRFAIEIISNHLQKIGHEYFCIFCKSLPCQDWCVVEVAKKYKPECGQKSLETSPL